MSGKVMPADADRIDDEALPGTLRLATGVTVAFVLCELLGWTPSFLGPVFTAAFLTVLPIRPPLKMAVSLVVVMAGASLFVYALSSLLRDAPFLLTLLLAILVFGAFRAMAGGRARLPALLLLICVATIPVIVTIAPAEAKSLSMAMIRGMALAMLIIQLVYAMWPGKAAAPPAPAATASAAFPGNLAWLGTLIVVPLMTVYLLFGLTDAFPVLIATVMLVANFDPTRGRLHALGLVAGNLGGGLLGVFLHMALLTTPTLVFLAISLFLVLMVLGKRIASGGPTAPVALIACNAMLIILSISIASGPASISLWLTRVSQFVLASLFAVGMMNLLWRRPD